jgi:Mg2+-importing ATPase
MAAPVVGAAASASALAAAVLRPLRADLRQDDHRGRQADEARGLDAYWTLLPSDVARLLGVTPSGLSSIEARTRLEEYGPNRLREYHDPSRLHALSNQLRSPLLVLLLFAAAASLATRAWIDALIVLTIVRATVAIGYTREYKAHVALAALRSRIRTRVSTLRDDRPADVDVSEIVPGDLVLLSAGSLIPADAVLLDCTDLFVSEAVLTGESLPVVKHTGPVDHATPLAGRTNCVFQGTNVRSGTARCLVVRTGSATHFGAIARRLDLAPPETDFDRGIKHFGYLLLSTMLVMTIVVFGGNMLAHRPPVETILFAIALAVGLSPELLPAILNANLTRSAQLMAAQGVLVRRLNAIENLGSTDVLCTDKTGTLTDGVVELDGAFDHAGAPSGVVLELAAWNAALETGLRNPLDDAILAAAPVDTSLLEKQGEAPFDFVRKRVTVAVTTDAGVRLITKGAFPQVLDICSRLGDGSVLNVPSRAALAQRHAQWSAAGIRVIAGRSRTLRLRAETCARSNAT